MSMREIKKIEMNQASNVDSKATGKADPQFCGEDSESKVVKDLSNQTEVLGRSQVNKTDNLSADVAFAMANPETTERADKLFDVAYAQLLDKNDPDAYGKACSIATSQEARNLLSK